MANQKHVIRGVLAGVAGGLVASWVMNEFMAGPGVKLQQAVQTDEQNQQQEQQTKEQEQSGEPKIDATMKAADAIVNTTTGGRHLSLEEKQKGGPIVHYAFGAIMGGVYGGLAEYSSLARSGFGTTFGSALFTGADLVAVPALKLSGAPTDSPASSYATPLAAHLVYGATTELVRRIVRSIL
jgi:putative membrane protein